MSVTVVPNHRDQSGVVVEGRILTNGELSVLLKLVEKKVATWDALCKCVDEFGDQRVYCGELMDADDTAMNALKSAFLQ